MPRSHDQLLDDALYPIKQTHGLPLRCQCESLDCTHAYLGEAAGEHRAMYVGRVCDACALTHMFPYLVTAMGLPTYPDA